MKKDKMYRHGDLLFKPVKSIPRGAKKIAGLVVEEGEVTGHAHRFVADTVQIFQDKAEKYVDVKEDTTIKHEEHKQLLVSKGKYHVMKEQQYNPFEGMVERVRD